MRAIDRRKKVVRVMESIWDSLSSHLSHAVEDNKACTSCGSRKFHSETIREYAQALKDLADTL